MVSAGQTATATVTVTESNIAKTMKSGTAKATVSAVDGRKITFDIEASDGVGIIGHGTHERFVINNEKFMSKVLSRAKSN